MRRQILLALGVAALFAAVPTASARLAWGGLDEAHLAVGVPEYSVMGYCGGGGGSVLPDQCCLSCVGGDLIRVP